MSAIGLETHPEGTILPVRAHAGARRNAIGAPRGDCLQVSVTQAPEKGKANKAIIGLLAQSLGLRKSQIELVSGKTSALKRLLVCGISPSELRDRIRSALDAREGR